MYSLFWPVKNWKIYKKHISNKFDSPTRKIVCTWLREFEKPRGAEESRVKR